MQEDSFSKNNCLKFMLERSKQCSRVSGVYNIFADVVCKYEKSKEPMLVIWRGEPREDNFILGRSVNPKLKKHWVTLAKQFLLKKEPKYCFYEHIKNIYGFGFVLGFSFGEIDSQPTQGLLVLSETVDEDYLSFFDILLTLSHDKIEKINNNEINAQVNHQAQPLTEDFYFQMLNSSDVMLITHRLDGRIVAVTDAFCKKSGYDREKLLESYIWDIETDYTEEGYKATWRELKKGPLLIVGRHVRADGSSFPMEATLNWYRSGGTDYVVAVMTDITEMKKYEQEIQKLTLAIEQSPVLVVITDTNHIIEYANQKTFEQMGYSEDTLIGQSVSILRSPKVDQEVMDDLDASLSMVEEWRGELLNMTIEEESFWVSAIVTPLLDEADEVAHYLYVMEDISDRKKFQETLEHQASYDSLTELPNRFYGMQQLDEAIRKAVKTKEKMGVFFLDLDTFKEINDTLGHEAGDKLLISIADRLLRACRKNDTVIRLGGDEFMIVVEHTQDMEDFEKIAEKLLALSRLPVQYGKHELKTSASIGLALLPEHGTDRKTLMRHADMAMYHSKSQGKNRWSVYEPDMLENRNNMYS